MTTLAHTSGMTEQDQQIAAAVAQESARLKQFIRRHVVDAGEAEDILQEVFYELVAAYRLMKPIEQIGSWLMRVARNRIIDRFRRKRHAALTASDVMADNADEFNWEELLPSLDDGPDGELTRNVLLREFETALAELPAKQRQIFIAHEFEGRSFKELAEAWGVTVNTLLSRKHAAVNSLRTRLQSFYDDLAP